MTESLASCAGLALTMVVFAVLLRAAVHKTRAFAEATRQAQAYGQLPARAVAPVVRGLAAMEWLAAGLLLVAPLRPLGGILGAALFLGYGGMMAQALWRGQREIDCGCGGAGQKLSSGLLARNALYAGAALLGGWLAPIPADLPATVMSVLAGALAFALIAIAEVILGTARPAQFSQMRGAS